MSPETGAGIIWLNAYLMIDKVVRGDDGHRVEGLVSQIAEAIVEDADYDSLPEEPQLMHCRNVELVDLWER